LSFVFEYPVLGRIRTGFFQSVKFQSVKDLGRRRMGDRGMLMGAPWRRVNVVGGLTGGHALR